MISDLSRNGEGLGIFPLLQCRDFDHWLAKDVRYKQLEINIEDLSRRESLKNVTRRSSQFWDEVIIPRLRIKKLVIIVGHENNLRSIRWYIRRCDHIPSLVYALDEATLQPVKQEDSAPGLSGRYLFDKEKLKLLAERDQQQVYLQE